jgi:hypothetical protein
MSWQVSVWRTAGRRTWMEETEGDKAHELHGVEQGLKPICEVLCSGLVLERSASLDNRNKQTVERATNTKYRMYE